VYFSVAPSRHVHLDAQPAMDVNTGASL
jgi:hypothetical protein